MRQKRSKKLDISLLCWRYLTISPSICGLTIYCYSLIWPKSQQHVLRLDGPSLFKSNAWQDNLYLNCMLPSMIACPASFQNLRHYQCHQIQLSFLVVLYSEQFLGGTPPHSDLDIWCSIAALPHLRRLIVAQGLVLVKIVRNYGQHSNPLIRHVEQYYLRPKEGER